MRRPELFAIAGSLIAGKRALVVERLAKGLNVKAATVPVVRALFRIVKALPEFAWNTRRLPSTALTVRDTFLKAKSPEQFLFVLLPVALGLPPISESKLNCDNPGQFFDALNETLGQLSEVMLKSINTARDSLLKACGLEGGQTNWTKLRHMALSLEPTVTEPRLLTFLRRVNQEPTDASGIESVLALVANRPPHSWSDADVDRFPEAAAATGRALQEAVRSRGGLHSADAQLAILTRKERRDAADTLSLVRRYLQRTAKDVSPRAVRAALTTLIEEIEQ
jgi:hypothetical protein